MYLSRSLLFSTVLTAHVSAQVNGPQSLVDDANFSKLRPCAQNCFFYGGHSKTVADRLGTAISCSRTTTLLSRVAENDCYCRTDLQPSAHLDLSTCVLYYCSSNTNDMTSAWSVYDGYCTANGYLAAAAQTDPQPQPTATGRSGTAATPAQVPGSGNAVTVTVGGPIASSKPSMGRRISLPWTLMLSGVALVPLP
jgi:hypothetical protein